MICVWSSRCHCYRIISCSSKIRDGLPFKCWLTKVVVEKRPLNGYNSSSRNSEVKVRVSRVSRVRVMVIEFRDMVRVSLAM